MRDTQLTEISKVEWIKLVKEKYPEAKLESFTKDSTFAYPTSDTEKQTHLLCLGAHSSNGNYGWVKGQ